MTGRRTSFWIRTFAHARTAQGWVKVPRLYTRTTAAQLASDISNAHRRSGAHRMRGVLDGEQWEAYWQAAPNGPAGDHEVWVRRVA